MLVFGFVGSASTGKTTSAKYVQRKVEGVKVITEGVREILKEQDTSLEILRSNPEQYKIFQEKICMKHIADINEAKKDFDIIITDRTVYDLYVYSKLFLGRRVAYPLFKKYEEMVTYDHLLFFTPLPFVYDGVRDRSKLTEERKEFANLKLDYDLKVTNKVKRKQQVCEYIKSIIDNEQTVAEKWRMVGRL